MLASSHEGGRSLYRILNGRKIEFSTMAVAAIVGIAIAAAPFARSVEVCLVVLCAIALLLLKRIPVSLASTLRPLRILLAGFCFYNGLGYWLYQGPDKATVGALLVMAAIAMTLGDVIGRDGGLVPRSRPLRPSIVLLRMSTLLGSVTMLALFAKQGVPVLSSDPNVARLSFFPSGYLSTLAIVPLYVSLTVAGILISSNRRYVTKKRRNELAVHGLVALLLLTSTANRGQLIAPLLTVIIWRAYHSSWRLLRVVALLIAGFAIISVTGYLRYRTQFGPTYDQNLALQGFGGDLRYFGTSLNYIRGTIQTLARTVAYFPSVVPHPLGQEFFGPLLHKPSTDRYLKQVFGLTFSGFGLALGAVNAFYLDWGPIGVIIGFFLIGYGVRRVYIRAISGNKLAAVLYCYLLGHLLLSNYGDPFAYLSDLLYPICLHFVLSLGETAFNEAEAMDGPPAHAALYGAAV